MRVKPHDGLTRFLVQSERLDDQGKAVEYLVDVVALWGLGKCSCEYFSYRLEPAIQGPIPLQLRDDSRCKHLKSARACLANELLEAMIRNELAKEKHTTEI